MDNSAYQIRDVAEGNSRKQVDSVPPDILRDQERLLIAKEAANLGIYDCDITSGEFTWDDRVREIWGVDPDESVGYATFISGINPDDCAAFRAIVDKSLDPMGDGKFVTEYRVTNRKDNLERWISATGQVFFEQGSAVRFVGTVQDITERKQAEHVLRHREREFAAMFEQSMVGMSQADPKTSRILRANKAFADMLGYSQEEMTRMTFVELTHPDDRERDYLEGYAPLRTGIGDRGEIEKRYLRKDGTVVWAHVSGTLIRRDDGTPAYSTAVIQNISVRKEAEYRLQNLNSELEQLVSERTAEITALANQLRELASELTLAEQRERQRIAKVLHDHIQQMLVAAKLQTAALVNPRRNEDSNKCVRLVNDLIDQAISASRNLTAELSPPVLSDAGFGLALQWLARNSLEKHGLKVEVEFDSSGEPRVEDVRILLFDAIRETLFNVVKHSGVQKAHVRCFRGGDDRVRVVVSDEGRGFDPTCLRTGGRSEGFGLFSVQQRLGHFGGRLEIESAPGQGTRITLIGPPPSTAKQLPFAAMPQPMPATQREDPSNGKIRVVVADDHHIVRQGLAGLLRSETDIEVIGEAANGAQAVNLARSLQPDVVVMDISMPVLNGVEATAEIRRDFPNTKVIGLSMHEEGELSSAIRQAGAVAYVTKGGAPEALVAAIRKAVGSR